MTERPILFSGPMVRAILDGRKTQTRRLVVCRSKRATDFDLWLQEAECPYGQPGGRLWVRETWRPAPFHLCGSEGCDCDDVKITYPADGASRVCTMAEGWTPPGGWKRYDGTETCAPSIHMPRWASRLTLEVTSIRVERLQDITEEDALAEGIPSRHEPEMSVWGEDPTIYIGPKRSDGLIEHFSAREAFGDWWDYINGDRATWANNPWVWCVGFKRVEVSSG